MGCLRKQKFYNLVQNFCPSLKYKAFYFKNLILCIEIDAKITCQINIIVISPLKINIDLYKFFTKFTT